MHHVVNLCRTLTFHTAPVFDLDDDDVEIRTKEEEDDDASTLGPASAPAVASQIRQWSLGPARALDCWRPSLVLLLRMLMS